MGCFGTLLVLRLSSLVIRTAARYRARRFIVWLRATSGARALDMRFTREGCMEISLAGRAAVILLAAALGSGVTLIAAGRDRRESSIAGEVLASHVRSLMPDHLTDVRSSDQHNVKPWFNGRLDYSPSVPRLEEQGFPLIGGRIDYVAGRPVAVVVYGRRQHMINVFSWPSPGAEVVPEMSASNGYTMIHWRSRGSEHWVLSDVNVAELQSFAALLRGADSAPTGSHSRDGRGAPSAAPRDKEGEVHRGA